MNKETIRIYHNPRCSKSRSACALLAAKDCAVEVVDYLQNPPDKAALRALLAKLGLPPLAIVRQGEAIFKAEYAGRELRDEAVLDVLVAHPILIERPIVVRGERAVIARPPEKLEELF